MSAPFSAKVSAKSFLPFAQEGSAPRLHVVLCRVTLDLDRNQKPVPDVSSGAPSAQSFVLWPIDCRDGTFSVDEQRERTQSDVPCHGCCKVLAISRILPWQNVSRQSPIRCRLEVPQLVDRHRSPASSPQRTAADEEPSVKMCSSRSPSGGRLCHKTGHARSGEPVGRMAAGSGKMPRANCSLY